MDSVDIVTPPSDTGPYAGTATSSGTSAANLNLNLTRGSGYYNFQARGGDVYVRFKSTASTAASTSGNSSNGLKIPDGQTVTFYLGQNQTYVDHIASAACTLFWWCSSPNSSPEFNG